MYSAMLLEHFENPRNVGEFAGASARVRVENPVCGDVLELSLRVEGGRIVEARFRAKGCVPSIACGSALTEIVTAMSLADARDLTKDDLLEGVGGVPAASGHAAALAIEALKQAIACADVLQCSSES
jgi:nitrogen fixation protein NifU and related proteins